MKKLLLPIFMLLMIMACTTTEDSNNLQETIITANSGGGPNCACGKAQRPDCPPPKYYNWSNMTTIDYYNADAPNIVILGDGFTSAEQSTFDIAATNAYNAFKTNNPGNGPTMPNTFNFYKAFMPSPESGISVEDGNAHPKYFIDLYNQGFKSTIFNSYSNTLSLTRLTSVFSWNRYYIQRDLIGDGTIYWDESTCSNTEAGIFTRKANGELNVYVLVILNTPMYGGSGEYANIPGATTSWWDYGDSNLPTNVPNTNFSVATVGLDTEHNGLYFKFLVQHETGHSIWNLGDLYGDAEYSTQAALYEPVFFNAPLRYNLSNTELDNNGQLWHDACERPEHWVNYLYDCPSCTGLVNQVSAPCGINPPGLLDGYPYYSGFGYSNNQWASVPHNYSVMEVIGGKWSPLALEIAEARMRHDMGIPPLSLDPYYD